MMMQNPDDNVFKDLLGDYAAPVADDGFTQTVMQVIDQDRAREERLRHGFIYGACFIGGVIAATQFSGLMGLVKTWLSRDLSLAQNLSYSSWTIAAIPLVVFTLWCALDQKTTELF